MKQISGGLIVASTLALMGCHDNTPPPPRVPVPAQHSDDRGDRTAASEREDAPQPSATYTDDRVARGNPRQDRGQDEMKPMPPQPGAQDEFHPPFDDVPLVSQRPPEERAFVEAYKAVNSPRIALVVNRSMPGDPIGSGDNSALDGGEQLRPLDYQAIESIMTDWLAANGQVTIVSAAPGTRQQQLDTDVLIQVNAQPTKQTRDGTGVRVIAEALNTRGGQSLARAMVDVPAPLEKGTINRSTRFLARKLMGDMTQAWMSPPPPDHNRDAGRGATGNEQAPAATSPPPTESPASLPERSVVTPPPAPARQPEIPPATQPTDPR